MASTRLTDLAKAILANSSELEAYLHDQKLPVPSFEEDAPAELPLASAEMNKKRSAIIDASLELHDLLVQPAMCLRPVLNATSLQAIYKYDMAAKVPRHGHISFAELAEACGLEEVDVRRIVRFAIAHHRVFQEKTLGMVSHSAASRYLADSPDAAAGLGFMFDEAYQAFAHTVESFETNREQPGRKQSGWGISKQVDVPMWTYHSTHPELGNRAARAMAAFTKGHGHDLTGLVRGYDWSWIKDKADGLVVDVGGAGGDCSIAVARAFPNIRFQVQDLPLVVAESKDRVPVDVKERVSFVAHDFFTPQPAPADAYLLRQILHNWPDADCVKLLRAITPGLKPGSRIIINDNIVPPPGVLPAGQDKFIRGMDMIMMSLFNAREREKQDWRALFEAADDRFGAIKAWKPEGSQLGLVEATWMGRR